MHYLRSYIKGCHICQLNRKDKPLVRQLQTRIFLNYRPLLRLSMDLKVMPRSCRGHRYLQKVLLDFKTRQLALLNKDQEYFQYNSGDLVYLISPLMSQLRTTSRKIMVKYVGPLVVYKIIDPHNYLLMTLDGKLLQALFEHERIKPAVTKTSEDNITNLAHIKQVMSVGMIVWLNIED